MGGLQAVITMRRKENNSNWWDDLCEYYNVSKERAIDLSERKTGRRPNLPSSKTCVSVSGKTFEELWNENPRETVQQKMDFYKDIGAWQCFRQCNYRSKFNYGEVFSPYLRSNSIVLEYGCGVAPFTNYIFDNYNEIDSMQFHLVDVVGEHLEFAKWRLSKKNHGSNITFYEVTEEHPVPEFKATFDVVCIMDVFEHLPNPLQVTENIINNLKCDSILVETWVDKSNGKHGGPDLEEAEKDRAITTALLKKEFVKISDGAMRVHRKK